MASIGPVCFSVIIPCKLLGTSDLRGTMFSEKPLAQMVLSICSRINSQPDDGANSSGSFASYKKNMGDFVFSSDKLLDFTQSAPLLLALCGIVFIVRSLSRLGFQYGLALVPMDAEVSFRC